MSRFGASKFRNAVASPSAREEWHRAAVHSGSGGNLQTSTFSSELKANHRHVVSVSPAGDVQWRQYGGEASTGKVGGVGDWDLGRVDDGQLAVGGTDGSITLYGLGESLESISKTPSGPPITSLALHPTTPSIVLAATKDAVTIWDLSSASPSTPKLSLEVTDPKGFWCVAWSPGGKHVAVIGKSGVASIFDPRTSPTPTVTRALPLQPLKPVKAVWLGSDLFITSFSRTRQREYHLFDPAKELATTFTQSVDTSTTPLIPCVDQERRIVYLTGKGDMTVRQVEVGGPTGSQETLHSLPHAVNTQGAALASPTTLEVMQAHIGTVLVPVQDKDGDAVLQLEVKVPRRQLIDFHEDLYPEVAGFTPEQSAEQWFAGGDNTPLPISLDPSRRGAWEKQLASTGTGTVSGRSSAVQTLPAEATAPTSAPPSEQAKSPAEAVTASDSIDTPDASRPPLEGDETWSSTDYKARIIGGHIGKELESYRASGKTGPMFVGLQGPQGCGKTTLCNGFVAFLKDKLGISAAVVSLDDLYHTNANLKAVARKHPNNKLLSGRGPSGTHDVALAVSVLTAASKLTDAEHTVDLPIFDKSLCGGEGDRSTEVIKVHGPIDVFILEGWSMGFAPLTPARLKERYASGPSTSPQPYFVKHPLESLNDINEYLIELADAIHPFFSTLVSVVPTSYEHVFQWRLQQEHVMKAANGGKGMSDEQVRAFVERYMPGYELWREGMYEVGWSGLELRYGMGREVLGVKVIDAPKGAAGADGSLTSPPASSAPAAAPPAEVKSTPATAPPTQKASVPAAAATASTATAPTPSKAINAPFNPGYSRKFLAGKSPLIPSYDSVPALSTLHPDSLVLKTSEHLAFFPVQGPGGRLGVHPLAKKGRMVTGGEGYLSAGSEIVDFDVAPFRNEGGLARVAVACDDGGIRVWDVAREGVRGAGPDAKQILRGKGVDKIAHIAFHPTAEDLLVALTNDSGSTTLRFFDVGSGSGSGSGQEALVVPLEIKGASAFAFHSSGRYVAIATKDSRVVVLDPRHPTRRAEGKAHSSPRSFQLAWVEEMTLLSVGFDRGSQRKINLYRVDWESSEVQTVHSAVVDVSPSVLFPVYDPDTRILYVWGKGERVISAYEVDVSGQAQEPLSKLPSFTAAEAQLGVAFAHKMDVDVRKVEVARALRLTARSVEEVVFTIPRNRPEFFQNDIFVDTLAPKSSLSSGQWIAGENRDPTRISLKPEGMTPLSQAPVTQTPAKKRFVPAKDVMSEEAKKKQEMDALFAKAKADESSDEEDEPPRSGLAPPDDW